MNLKNVSYWLIIIIFIAVGAVSWQVYFKKYRQTDSLSIHHFPKVINNWKSEDLPISNDEKALLETDNVFVRRYTNGKNDEVFLFIVYSQNNRKVSHPPEICYTGGGATILDSTRDSIAFKSEESPIEVNRLKVERGRITQIFTYWFKVGNSFTSNYWKQQAMIAYKTLLGWPSSSALIRVSSTVKNGNEEDSIRLIKEFGRQMIPHLNTYIP